MHGSKHACDKLVDAIAFLDQWYQSRYPAFIIGASPEMCEYQFLKGVNLILKGHKIRDGLISFGSQPNEYHDNKVARTLRSDH